MNFALESIQPLELPSLPLSWRKGFPSCSAIYFAILDKEILYIGRTVNLVRRWVSHHREAELEIKGEVRIAWIEVSDPLLLPPIEDALIKYFKPLLNKRGVKIHKALKGKRKGNPQKFLKHKVPLANRVTVVRLPVDLDEFVHSLPNRTEWLRKAIADAYEREQQQKNYEV